MSVSIRPTKFICYELGEKEIVQFQLLNENNMPASGFIVRILSTALPNGYFDLPPSDEHGTTSFFVSYPDEAERITIVGVILGTDLKTWFNRGTHHFKGEHQKAQLTVRLPEPPKKLAAVASQETIDPITRIMLKYDQIHAQCEKMKTHGRSEADIEAFREKMETLLLSGVLS